LYFDFLQDTFPMDIVFYGDHSNRISVSSKLVILGGGGLFVFEGEIQRLAADPLATLICWGAGHNVHGSNQIGRLDILHRFKLAGIRDFDCGFEWVPCASCMASDFDQSYPISHDVVLYEHHQFRIPDVDPAIPRLSNDCMDLGQVISFLGSGELVLTSSYHGAYWATLLGRKVIIINPFSSKFFGMKHKHTLCSHADWRAQTAAAQGYPGALAECRAANRAFSEKAADLVRRHRRHES
jgi:hypothetical protein